MSGRIGKYLERRRLRKVQARWTLLTDEVSEMDKPTLKAWKGRALSMRGEIDRLIHAADARLASAVRPLPTLPLGTDWSWRPDLWQRRATVLWTDASEARTAMSSEVELHHDSSSSELIVRQNTQYEASRKDYALTIESYGFEGSFLSVTLILPEAAAKDLKASHILRLDTKINVERPVRVYVRLNIKHGPNTEQLLGEPSLTSSDQMVEFDLAYAKFNDRRVERMWIDVIFDRPAVNLVNLRDMVVSRRPRAGL